MAKFDMQQYARRGAEARIQDLNDELNAIYAAFPDLRRGVTGRSGRRPRAAGTSDVAGTASAPPQGARKRRKMSAAQRKAVGERMRRYWAARRSAQSTKKR